MYIQISKDVNILSEFPVKLHLTSCDISYKIKFVIIPWGNHIQIVEYKNFQYTKTTEVLKAMGLGDLGKSDQALQELRHKGMA